MKSKAVFWFYVLLYLFFRLILFKGFNGSDDLHYAMYSADMLHGKFNPFIRGESISGRLFLIGIQALIYKIGGIGVLTTQIGTLLACIGTIYLVLFKIMQDPDAMTVWIGSALFFGNLALLHATKGILPDAYVMLFCAILFIMLRQSLKSGNSKAGLIRYGLMMGTICGLCLFIKESCIIFIPVLCIVSLMQDKKKGLWISGAALISFVFIMLLIGLAYLNITGNFFYKLYQLKTGGYDTDYTHRFFGKIIIVRLSYGLWLLFIVSGFYPVVFAIGYIVGGVVRDKFHTLKRELVIQFFIVLSIVAYYFPVHIYPYLPLPPEPRQFLFLLPFATLISIRFYSEARNDQSLKALFVIIGGISLLICIISTQNKWQWMIYGFITLLAYFRYAFSEDVLINKFQLLPVLLWFSLCEGLFFLHEEWFRDSLNLRQQLYGRNVYFPDRDNFMHWKLFNHFDTAENHLILVLSINDVDSGNFKPGWVIINKQYNSRSAFFLNKMDSLGDSHFFPAVKASGVVNADSISSFTHLKYIFTNAP